MNNTDFTARNYVTPLSGILLLQFVVVIALAMAPKDFLVRKLTDDAFYFFKTAQNMAAGNGMTFDGIHRTNGMQIIWILLLTPIYMLFDGLWIPIRASILLQGIIMSFSSILFYISIKKLFNTQIAGIATVVLVFNPYVVFMYLGGHEAAVNYFFLTAILYILAAMEIDLKNLTILGFICGLAFLARLDNVILIAVLGGVLIGTRTIDNFRKLTAFAITSAVLPVIYVLYNLLSFGHVVPVSGKVLGTASTSVVIVYVFVWGGIALLTSYLMTSSGFLSTRRAMIDKKMIIVMFAIAGIAHLGYYLFLNSKLAIWYLPVETISATLVGSYLLTVLFSFLTGQIDGHRGKVVSWILVVLILSSYGTLGAVDKLDSKEDGLGQLHYEQGKWLRNNTACDAVIGSGNAGQLGYFSQRHVVELNGLANSYQFVEQYQGNHSKYILERRPDYIVDYQPHIEKKALNQANYSQVHKISIVTQEQTPMKPTTMLRPNERRFVHEVWKANGTELKSNPNCSQN